MSWAPGTPAASGSGFTERWEWDLAVLEQLMAEHRDCERLIDRLSHTDEGAQRIALLERLTATLRLHMAVEEHFLVPVIQSKLGWDQARSAHAEHALMRHAIKKTHQLVDEPGFRAAVEMLRAGFDHHVREEEGEVFVALRRDAPEQLAELGLPAMQERVRSISVDVSREELYERARVAGIPGRSHMSKAELADALAACGYSPRPVGTRS
jgi:hypothetical protein